MTKIIITILAIYLFYYAGNIIYDLYFKKDNSEKKEEIEEFSLNEFAEYNNDKVQDIRIDDVENINVPSSFNSKELSIIKQEQDESRDLSYFRKKFLLIGFKDLWSCFCQFFLWYGFLSTNR
jgi:superfamily II helicase